MSQLDFILLGSGSSGGVPRADGAWGACDPAQPRNRRSRCSLLVRRRGEGTPRDDTTLIVDTSPDFRLQAVAADVGRVDAVLFTHDHADQVHGIDDLRPFFQHRREPIPTVMDVATRDSLTARFAYVFGARGGYSALCRAVDLPPHGQAWRVEGPSGSIPATSFDLDHGDIRSVGYRFGDVAYTPDVVRVPEASWPALEGLEVWIIDALRWTPHPTHAHVARALEWIARARPRRAILTNLHIDLDYDDLAARLPPGVEPAYDGMTLSVALSM